MHDTHIGKIQNPLPTKRNKSGVIGVYMNKRGKWVATIGFKKQSHYLGCFDTLEEATAARQEAEERLWKPFLEWLLNQD